MGFFGGGSLETFLHPIVVHTHTHKRLSSLLRVWIFKQKKNLDRKKKKKKKKKKNYKK